jgi:hypothetical protein
MIAGISPETKFVPILRSGTPAEAIPHFLRTKRYVDFSDDHEFDHRLDELVRFVRFSRVRSDAFVLGTTMVFNINAVSQSPRHGERIQDLWRSISGLCTNLGIEEPLLPGRNQVLDGDTAFKETLPILERMKQRIAEAYGPSVMKPYWLGIMSALASQFLQNPDLTAMAAPLLREIENLAQDCSVPDGALRPFLAALQSGNPQKVMDAILPFIADVSEIMEASQ